MSLYRVEIDLGVLLVADNLLVVVKYLLCDSKFPISIPIMYKWQLYYFYEKAMILNTYKMSKNVFGEPLEACCFAPKTGFFRDGYCQTGPEDLGTHTVCAIITGEFLAFTKQRGNDLSTPVPAYQFPGLKAGDKWCLCALRWKEAYLAGQAPYVVLEATNEKTLEIIPIDVLVKFAHKTQK